MTALDAYRRLAERLDALPNGFPPAPDGSDVRLLAHLFSPEEAGLAAELRLAPETPAALAGRLERDPSELRQQLKGMARRGLIAIEPTEAGLGYKLLPFVVGIYEMQVATMDAELAALFEDYFKHGFAETLRIQPAVHRVIPIQESIPLGIAVRPYESAAAIVTGAQAWGVIDCICRKQQALIGKPCGHPLDVCLVLSSRPGAFDQTTQVKALSMQQALDTLQRAAAAGLVHSTSNHRSGFSYICNCCTCSCGILRGMAELGVASVVAHSGFVNTVDEQRCLLCGECLEYCQFDALSLDASLKIDGIRCAGCGVCVPFCPQEALALAPRPASEITPPPESELAWLHARAAARHQALDELL